MASVFSRIIAKEIPAHIIAEDADHIAFLDISPRVWGHTLVVPKTEVDLVFDLPDVALAQLMVFAKHVAGVLAQQLPCRRVGLAVVGLEVPHAHIHLLPLQAMEDMDLMRPSLSCTPEMLCALSQKLSEAFTRQWGQQ